MPLTRNQVLAHLTPEEPDYPKAATELGPEALPVLRDLVATADPLLASKATYLASLLNDDAATDVLRLAAESAHPVVRVAAASGVRNLRPDDADEVVDRLLDDADLGVRKVTAKSLRSVGGDRATERLNKIASDDPDETLRGIAARLLADGPG